MKYLYCIIFLFFSVTKVYSVIDVVSVQNIHNSSQCNGEIDIIATGNAGPFTFSWTGPDGFTSQNEDLTGLCNYGTYCVVVTNNVGCETVKCVDICYCRTNFHDIINEEPSSEGLCTGNTGAVPPNIYIDYELYNPTNEGSNNGSIDLNVQGGLPDLYYEWTGPNDFVSGTEDISHLIPGEYCVEVTDGCSSKSVCVLVETCVFETINISGITANTCEDENGNDYNVGTIAINITGGRPPYVISWNNGVTGAGVHGLSSGTYCVVVKDHGNCNIGEACFDINTEETEPGREGCTLYTICDDNIVESTTLDSETQINKQNCRYEDLICSDGYVIEKYNFIGTNLIPDILSCSVTEHCWNSFELLGVYHGTEWKGITDDCYYVEICDLSAFDLGTHITFEEDKFIVTTIQAGQGPDAYCQVEAHCNGTLVYQEFIDGPCPPIVTVDRPTKSQSILANEIVERKPITPLKDYEKENLISKKDTTKIKNIVGKQLKSYIETVKEKLMAINSYSKNFDFKDTGYFVYPNPFKDIITIDLVKAQKTKDSNIKIVLRNILGEEVFAQNYTDMNIKLIGMRDLPNGVYLLEIQGENDYQEVIRLLKTDF